MSQKVETSKYIITTALMGFGHMRAAHNIAGYGHAAVVRVDREPYVGRVDKIIWNGAQGTHTQASREADGKNKLLYNWFEGILRIPEGNTPPSMAASKFVHVLDKFGMGRPFFDSLDGQVPSLLHTFYLHAMFSVYRKYPGKNFLLLCDTDFHRVWVPVDPKAGNIEYMVPISKSADRLVSYGVRPERIHVTGFPLPVADTGAKDMHTLVSALDARKGRLRRDSKAPLSIMFPFSGSGAYFNAFEELVKSMFGQIKDGSLRLVVSCGDNDKVFADVERLFNRYGLYDSEQVQIIFDEDIFHSFDLFNEALKSTDLVITKPSEMVFYAALGIPMLFLPPIGAHEAGNREYLIDNGCAVDLPEISGFPKWLAENRTNERLLSLAEMGYRNLPKTGAFDIHELVVGGE
jgi:hypothetical protein